MYCSHCGYQIRQGSKFCEKCGTKASKQKVSSQKSGRTSPKAKLVLGIISLIVLGVLFVGFYISENNFPRYSMDESGLRRSVERRSMLTETKNEESARELYNNFLSPKDRAMSEDEFVNGFLDFWNRSSNKYIRSSINAISISGNEGYVDRNHVYCRDPECNVIEKVTRNFLKVEYEDGHWYYRATDVLCPRENYYDMSPEFIRALSLIKQRSLASTAEGTWGYGLKEVMNCVSIEYASSESEISGAEGVFLFIPGQSPEKMTILVSPRYRDKDDILTASLLIHELTHAYNFAIDQSTGEVTDCFENEAYAFTMQNEFLTTLNYEERQSLIARLAAGGSPEVINVAHVFLEIPRMRGNSYHEKALNFVKASPFYQKQCSS